MDHDKQHNCDLICKTPEQSRKVKYIQYNQEYIIEYYNRLLFTLGIMHYKTIVKMRYFKKNLLKFPAAISI